ncbi:HAMP domain-containing protein, partial [Pseudomonas costantinii]|uniref:HAMP domain-containing protein n=1 Tax=Pseudomonas costantinii TaxID=168469 RepID=UPI0015A00D67|nr:HAMP domain-containing protein [Pseudomonas costantinii]
MRTLNGLSRQIMLSMSAVVLCVIALAVIGSYIFYAVLWAYWPLTNEEADQWLPSNIEWAWMGLTTCVSLAVGSVVALKLSRRILMPLNSVAENLRKLADGDLDVQAVAGDQSIGEATILVDDFNSMAKRLKHMAHEQAFWNAA